MFPIQLYLSRMKVSPKAFFPGLKIYLNFAKIVFKCSIFTCVFWYRTQCQKVSSFGKGNWIFRQRSPRSWLALNSELTHHVWYMHNGRKKKKKSNHILEFGSMSQNKHFTSMTIFTSSNCRSPKWSCEQGSSCVQTTTTRNLQRAKQFMHTSACMHSILKHPYLSQVLFDSCNLLKWNAW